ncbi:sugar kinase [Streptomyces pathocidini]|uniref:Sugar kinase n=1 Tax=Streptomyces pathocidini TaxID=1650571 RepID=A0ABW7USC9_9ACTN|nr:sugar kinase [Streptomyces pathocidini]
MDRVDGARSAGAAVAAGPGVEVVCLGESMVTFLPTRPGRLADVPAFERGIGGAESNVACTLARAGHAVRWVSRVGADGFGEHLVGRIAAHGVDVADVRRDPHRPTGVYFRTAGERVVSAAVGAEAGSASAGAGSTSAGAGSAPAGEQVVSASAGERGASAAVGEEAHESAVEAPGCAVAEMREEGAHEKEARGEVPGEVGAYEEAPGEVAYYRAGSAAAAMSPALVPRDVAWSGRVLHLSGITAALSDDCLALVRELTAPRPGRPLVSFDVNYRVGLWQAAARRKEAASGNPVPGAAGPRVLLDLARGADLVFVGEDEAEAAWGVRGAEDLRDALPEPGVLVVKQGARGAVAYARQADGTDTITFEPALAVDVVAHVGAGDAFAAGFLSGTLRGLPIAARLRHGHLMAAAALAVPGDLAAPPARAHANRLAALDPAEWAALRLGPGWTGREGEMGAEVTGPVEAGAVETAEPETAETTTVAKTAETESAAVETGAVEMTAAETGAAAAGAETAAVEGDAPGSGPSPEVRTP